MQESWLMTRNRKKAGALVLFFLWLIFSAAMGMTAEDAPALFPIRQNGKFGYINAAGETAITPQFSRDGSEGGKLFRKDYSRCG